MMSLNEKEGRKDDVVCVQETTRNRGESEGREGESEDERFLEGRVGNGPSDSRS